MYKRIYFNSGRFNLGKRMAGFDKNQHTFDHNHNDNYNQMIIIILLIVINNITIISLVI